MDYFGTKRGNVLTQILSKKHIDLIKNFEYPQIDFADNDGMRKFYANERFEITNFERLDLDNEYRIYKKKYPKTVEFNLKCLDDYLNLCHEHNIEPFCVLFPFSISARHAYPEESITEFRELLSKFKDKMYFIDLWDINIADSNFRNASHLNISGSRIVTNIIKNIVDKILKI